METMFNSLTCCLCNYRAATERKLEQHIDVAHADIFKHTFPTHEQLIPAVKEEQAVVDPVAQSLQEISIPTVEETPSVKRRNWRKKETPVEHSNETKTSKKGRRTNTASYETEILGTSNALSNPIAGRSCDDVGRGQKRSSTRSEADVGRGQKRPSTRSEAEPSSKRVSETSISEEKPVLQAASFIEALGNFSAYEFE